MFVLFTFDLDNLRTKYRLISSGSSPNLINRLPRSFMVDAIIAKEYGDDALVKYKTKVNGWNRTEQEIKEMFNA